jgi:hypothetical protein
MHTTRSSDRFENVAQFSMKATGYTFSFALLAALITAWIITGPIFQLGDQIAYRVKQKANRRKLKRRVGIKEIGLGTIPVEIQSGFGALGILAVKPFPC